MSEKWTRESIKKATKQQLKSFLTGWDVRLPAQEKARDFYLKKALNVLSEAEMDDDTSTVATPTPRKRPRPASQRKTRAVFAGDDAKMESAEIDVSKASVEQLKTWLTNNDVPLKDGARYTKATLSSMVRSTRKRLAEERLVDDGDDGENTQKKKKKRRLTDPVKVKRGTSRSKRRLASQPQPPSSSSSSSSHEEERVAKKQKSSRETETKEWEVKEEETVNRPIPLNSIDYHHPPTNLLAGSAQKSTSVQSSPLRYKPLRQTPKKYGRPDKSNPSSASHHDIESSGFQPSDESGSSSSILGDYIPISQDRRPRPPSSSPSSSSGKKEVSDHSPLRPPAYAPSPPNYAPSPPKPTNYDSLQPSAPSPPRTPERTMYSFEKSPLTERSPRPELPYSPIAVHPPSPSERPIIHSLVSSPEIRGPQIDLYGDDEEDKLEAVSSSPVLPSSSSSNFLSPPRSPLEPRSLLSSVNAEEQGYDEDGLSDFDSSNFDSSRDDSSTWRPVSNIQSNEGSSSSSSSSRVDGLHRRRPEPEFEQQEPPEAKVESLKEPSRLEKCKNLTKRFLPYLVLLVCLILTGVGFIVFSQDTLFCDTGSLDIAGNKNVEFCIPCYEHATCQNGRLTCDDHFELSFDGQSCREMEEIGRLADEMLEMTRIHVGELTGKFECGEIDPKTGYLVNHLVKELEMMRYLRQRVNAGDLFVRAYEKMKKTILRKASPLELSGGVYRSKQPIKSYSCRMKQCVADNMEKVFAMCLLLAVALLCLYKRYKNAQRRREVEETYSKVIEQLKQGREPRESESLRSHVFFKSDPVVWNQVEKRLRDDKRVKHTFLQTDNQQSALHFEWRNNAGDSPLVSLDETDMNVSGDDLDCSLHIGGSSSGSEAQPRQENDGFQAPLSRLPRNSSHSRS